MSVIPSYLNAQVVVAEGLHDGLPGQWHKYIDEVKQIAKAINYDEAQPNQGTHENSITIHI